MSNFDFEFLQKDMQEIKRALKDLYIAKKNLDNFVKIFSEKLEQFKEQICDPISMIPIDDPYYLNPETGCMHTFSKAIIIQIANKKCPICAQEYTFDTIKPNHIMHDIISDLDIATQQSNQLLQQNLLDDEKEICEFNLDKSKKNHEQIIGFIYGGILKSEYIYLFATDNRNDLKQCIQDKVPYFGSDIQGYIFCCNNSKNAFEQILKMANIKKVRIYPDIVFALNMISIGGKYRVYRNVEFILKLTIGQTCKLIKEVVKEYSHMRQISLHDNIFNCEI